MRTVGAMLARVMDQLGSTDILVNNAARVGGAPATPGIEKVPDDTIMTEMNTKGLGYLCCAREVVPGMKAAGWGHMAPKPKVRADRRQWVVRTLDRAVGLLV